LFRQVFTLDVFVYSLAVKTGNGTQGGPNSRIQLPVKDDPYV